MTAVHGDATLATKVRSLTKGKHQTIAAATHSPRGTTVASVGASLDADFELGSVSKGMTGLLYVDALTRGEVIPTTTLGELLPLGNVPAATVPLAAISTHRSGLPGLPASTAPVRRTLSLWLRGTNPYGDSLEQLVAQAREVKLGKPRARYSNFGYELLGRAVAHAAGMGYADLVHQRIAKPLGLTACYVPAWPDQLRPGALRGRSRSGRVREPWTGEAIGPAGGVRASIGDMARLMVALLDGSAPGTGALDAVADFSRRSVRIGAGWIALDHGGRSITWHNGGTGGFRSWIGLDREAGTGVVLMTATSTSVDRHGFRLLAELTKDGGRPKGA